MGAPSSPYTKQEDMIIRRMCAEGANSREMSECLPGRTRRSIMHRLVYLNLKAGPPPRNWTEGEIQILKKGLEDKVSCEALVKLLPKRTLHGMVATARKLGMDANVIFRQIALNRGETKGTSIKRPQPTTSKMRPCMACGRKFASWGIGNRLCDEHRRMVTGIDL